MSATPWGEGHLSRSSRASIHYALHPEGHCLQRVPTARPVPAAAEQEGTGEQPAGGGDPRRSESVNSRQHHLLRYDLAKKKLP